MKNKTQINVYLTFAGNCREAMEFYRNCFGGELEIQTVGDSPMAAQWPADKRDKILHAALTNKSLILLASDMGGEKGLKIGNTISLALTCSTNEEIEIFFTKLSDQGKVTHPLHQFYDGTIGAVTDKYGMNWVLKL